jgi:hypothetical protein
MARLRQPVALCPGVAISPRAPHRLRDAPARFEVDPHAALVPPMSRRWRRGSTAAGAIWAARRAIAALTAGRAAYAHLLMETLASQGSSADPTAALATLCAPDGRLTARCRESYDFRLSRARGFGALKAILWIWRITSR